uniref:Uncharacterized protein n=1 Tax=Strongyloides stercoralis TaxID=6248 RepID=A0AAF5D106_STRER
MLFYFKYLFIYFIFYIKFSSSSDNGDGIEGSGEDEDYEGLSLGDLLIYDQGLPIPKFPILARSSGKSGLIPLMKGTKSELTGFTNGLTDEMKKLLSEDKEGKKFSRRKNNQIASASLYNVTVDSRRKNNLSSFKSIEGSREDDLYNNLPDNKGEFLIEKKPFYLGAMIRNNGMKSLNAFNAYGKSRIMRLFNKGNSGYGSSYGDMKYELKPGQYFAGQKPPTINFQNHISDNNNQNYPKNVVVKNANYRNIVTNNMPKTPIVSNNVIQNLLTSANSATKTYNRMRVMNSDPNINLQKTYLVPALSKVGIVNSPKIKDSNQITTTSIQNNNQQNEKILPMNNKSYVHGISMTQFKKYPKPSEGNENNNNHQTASSKNLYGTTFNMNSYQTSEQNHFNKNLNTPPNNQQFLNTINENTPVLDQIINQKSINNNINYGQVYRTQLNNIIDQQRLPDIDKSHPTLQRGPSQKESSKNLFIYSNNQQNNHNIENFNNKLYNKNINLPSNYNNDVVEVTCCDGSIIFSTMPCCNLNSKINDNENYQSNSISNNVHYTNQNDNSEEYGDVVGKTKNEPTFRSYRPISKVQPSFANMESFSPLPERIGDIYSNNFGSSNI